MGQDDQTETLDATRRALLGAGAAAVALATLPAEAQTRTAPPALGAAPHEKGPIVFRDYDQAELDAAYDQAAYAPNLPQILKRYASNSEATRSRLGAPQRLAYGPTEIEKLDLFRAKGSKAPIFVFLHGGAWRSGAAKDYAFPAEMFVAAGAHYIVPDFIAVQDADGSLLPMADQVRRATAWVWRNAASFGGDPDRLYLGGHSSGGHLAGVVLTTDWPRDFNLPPDIIKGGLCCSGMYDLHPVRLSARGKYVHFTDQMEQAMSSQRHLDHLTAPLVVAYGTNETPEFQRQNRDFAAAVKAQGKPVELLVGENYNHFEMMETLANPYGVLGRAALKQMGVGLTHV